jgi:hypothetical protein
MSWKVQHKSNFVQVGDEGTYGHLCGYIQGSPFEIQTLTHWKLTGCSMTASLPVLSPNSILLLPSPLCFHCVKEKFGAILKKWYYLKFPYLLKNFVSQNCVTWSGVSRGVSVEKSLCLKALTDKFIFVLMWLLFTKSPYLLQLYASVHLHALFNEIGCGSAEFSSKRMWDVPFLLAINPLKTLCCKYRNYENVLGSDANRIHFQFEFVVVPLQQPSWRTEKDKSKYNKRIC